MYPQELSFGKFLKVVLASLGLTGSSSLARPVAHRSASSFFPSSFFISLLHLFARASWCLQSLVLLIFKFSFFFG